MTQQPDLLKIAGAAMSCAEIIDKFPRGWRRIVIEVLSKGYDQDGNNLVNKMTDELIAELPRCDCGKLGINRTHNTLPCGVHCDECWQKLLDDYRRN